jgi:hypothetical protein
VRRGKLQVEEAVNAKPYPRNLHRPYFYSQTSCVFEKSGLNLSIELLEKK